MAVRSKEMEQRRKKTDEKNEAGGWDATRLPGKKRNTSGQRTKIEQERDRKDKREQKGSEKVGRGVKSA